MSTKKDTFTKFLLNASDTMKELTFIYLGIVLIASVLFTIFEPMHFWDAVWMSFVTSTSTGYGDFFPKTIMGRLTGIGLMISSIFIVIPLIVTRLVQATMVDTNAFTHDEQEWLKNRLEEINTQNVALQGQLDQIIESNKTVA